MRLATARHDAAGRPRVPDSLWWPGYLVLAIWAQEMTGGLDCLAPALLVCLQSGRWWTAAWVAVLWVLVQEGVGNLAFGIVILFYAGMCVFFLLSRWLLEPANPVFILFFSLLLAVWSRIVLGGAVSFQELTAILPSPWPYVAKQWAAYAFLWALTLWAYRRWGSHGRA